MKIKLLPAFCVVVQFIILNSFQVFVKAQNTAPLVNKPASVTITGVGDIMPGTSYPSCCYLPPGDNPYVLIGEIADSVRTSDLTFGNLEGSFLNEGEPFKKCRDTSICYLFRIPEKYAGVLSSAGFDIISLANNHFGDFGWQAASTTMRLLDSLGIHYAGTEEVPYSIFVKDSVIYGFCAFSYTAGAVNINDTGKTCEIVKMLDRKCDVVIVSFHGGAEGAEYQRVPKTTEYFYGENRGNVYEFAHRMIDCGADIVFGHGPHVPRAMELYRNRLICYSLGNFFTYGRFNITGPNGIAPVIKVKTDITGKFISGTIIPAVQHPDGFVRYDPSKRAIRKIRELTMLDFPGTELEITDDGKIVIK
jgi:hypothetical protein